MRISDWSSDVCSSDLARQQVHVHAVACAIIADRQTRDQEDHARDQQRYGRVVEPIAERDGRADRLAGEERSEAHTSELQSLMRISYAVFCLKKKKKQRNNNNSNTHIQQATPRDTEPG